MIIAETYAKGKSNLIISLSPKVDPIHELGINATVTDKARNEMAWSATKGMHRSGASVLKSVAYDRMSLRADNLSYRMHRNSNAMSALCSQPVWQDGCAIDAVDESACGSFSIRSCKTRLGALCCINADRRVRWCRSIQANWGNRTVAADKHCIGGCDHLLAWLRHWRELLAPLPSLEDGWTPCKQSNSARPEEYKTMTCHTKEDCAWDVQHTNRTKIPRDFWYIEFLNVNLRRKAVPCNFRFACSYRLKWKCKEKVI